MTFADHESALKAINDFNQVRLGDNYVYVQQHFSKKEVELQIKQPNSAFNVASLQ